MTVRATGAYLDYEIELRSPLGLNGGMFGLELGVELPAHLSAEVGGELLTGSPGLGWAAVVRLGRPIALHGERGVEHNLWRGALVPLLGIRGGLVPSSGMSEGYEPVAATLGPQLALAYDLEKSGPRLGFVLRFFSAFNYRVYNHKTDNAWAYAAGEPAAASIELGLSLGVTIPVL